MPRAVSRFGLAFVLVAVVLELKIRIVTIPYTPLDSAHQWRISTYGMELEGDIVEVVLGNNDVHYMWICFGEDSQTLPGSTKAQEAQALLGPK